MRNDEDILQAKCYQWFHNNYPHLRKTLWAIPNGGSRNKYEAMKLKATGTVKGVHDLHFLHNSIFYTFELKVNENILSDDQIAFYLAIEKQGGKCFEIRKFEDFKNSIEKIISNVVPLLPYVVAINHISLFFYVFIIIFESDLP
jgi:hypothetical protein